MSQEMLKIGSECRNFAQFSYIYLAHQYTLRVTADFITNC